MNARIALSIALFAAATAFAAFIENAAPESSGSESPEPPALSPVPTYTCGRATGPLSIDGNLNEASWKRATEIRLLDNSGNGSPMQPATAAKLLWDDKCLYLAFVAEDSDIHATMRGRDEHLWTEEVVEVFIGQTHFYLEIEVNPLNTLFDGRIDIRGQTGRPKFDVDAILKVNYDIKHSVAVEGTVENQGDKDKRWTVEMAIPHSALEGIQPVPPKEGDTWRMNLYRIDRSREGGAVKVCAGAWSPTAGWFHNPERFAKIVFSSQR